MAEKICRRCLLEETDDTALYETMRAYIDSLPADIKIPCRMYEERIIICKGCEELINGMCRLCGCFVEVRAAKKNNHCAKAAAIW